MLKIWAFTFICIALYANVAVCDDIEFFENASVDLIKNLPNHFKDAIVELEKEDSANASMNITERIKFPRLPRLSQCFKDYLHMYTALLRKQSRSWALQGITFKLNDIFKNFVCRVLIVESNWYNNAKK